MSQTSAETTGNLGANAVNQMGQDYMGAANARASGYIGTANTLTKGINSLVGSFTGGGGGTTYQGLMQSPQGQAGMFGTNESYKSNYG